MISDIDECEGETIKCSSDAVCNNAKGYYNCTCKLGFEGDGYNCKGKLISFVIWSVFACHRLVTSAHRAQCRDIINYL